jgi:hypothetical protein
VLPFFPLFLAAMNLVVLATDTYRFCCHGSMSLASFAQCGVYRDPTMPVPGMSIC